jgi:hypothetical protein
MLPLLDIGDAAKLAGVTEKRIRSWLHTNKLRCIRGKGRTLHGALIDRADLEACIEEMKTAAPVTKPQRTWRTSTKRHY